MRWFWETRLYQSAKNGLITVTRDFDTWRVEVKGYSETSEGLNTIWVNACKRVGRNIPSQPYILLLGLAGGGIIGELHTLFPSCAVTAVEHDEVMIRIFEELKLYMPHPHPTIVCGDAAVIVPTLQQQFDLIIVDLFYGNQPPTFLKEREFLRALQDTLTAQGVALINVCDSIEYLDAAEEIFPRAERWRDGYNLLGAFWSALLDSNQGPSP